MSYEYNKRKQIEEILFNERIDQNIHLSDKDKEQSDDIEGLKNRVISLDERISTLEETVKYLNYNGCVFIRQKKD